MTPPATAADRLALALAILLSLATVALAALTPAFAMDNSLVYGRF